MYNFDDINNVASSDIDRIGYNYKNKDLLVCFKSGTKWVYHNFPSNLYNDFLNAESKGKFFHRYIKKQYTPNGKNVTNLM